METVELDGVLTEIGCLFVSPEMTTARTPGND